MDAGNFGTFRVYQLMHPGATTMAHQEENIWIPVPQGRLRATLHWPGRCPAPYPIVIGVHGLLSNRHSRKQIDLARCCTARGMAYLRFDHRGRGDSPGDLARDTSLTQRVADLATVFSYLEDQNNLDTARTGLFGSSFGGTVCLAFAADHPVSALVTLAAPIRSRPLMALSSDLIPQAVPVSFFEKQRQFDLRDRVPAVHHLLCCHGEADAIVPPAHAREIEALAGKPKELLIFPGADHRLSSPAQREILMQRARAWFSRYLLSE
jgi:alpha-beta hydrolase superfamily lysophospholipase